MKENLDELALQADFDVFDLEAYNEKFERFAELVRQDYIEEMNGHTLKMVMIAIAREREACAMLCEEWYLSGDVAKAIRSRN